MFSQLHINGLRREAELTVCVPSSQVAPKELEKCLTQRSFMTARESVTKALTSDQAVDGRDAFVKVRSLTETHVRHKWSLSEHATSRLLRM